MKKKKNLRIEKNILIFSSFRLPLSNVKQILKHLSQKYKNVSQYTIEKLTKHSCDSICLEKNIHEGMPDTTHVKCGCISVVYLNLPHLLTHSFCREYPHTE